MIAIGATSPWYPLVIAQVIRHAPGAVTPVPYEHWLLWRRHCVVPPQSQDDMLTETRLALLTPIGGLPQ